MHFLYAAPALLLIGSSILVCVSLWTRRPAGRVDSVIWTAAYFRAESARLRTLPLWRNYRVQAALLLVLTACIVIKFR
jgi:SSS family solute:Na+ symporter